MASETEPNVNTPLLSGADTNQPPTSETCTAAPVPGVTILETRIQYRQRWRSIKIMYFTMFLSSINFTVIMPTIWPYLNVVDANATPSFLGYVVAGFSLGQLVASPIFGIWSARKGPVQPLLVSMLLQIGSSLLYAYVQSIDHVHGGFILISARILMGFSSGNAAVVRAFVSGSTNMDERTTAMALVSLFQSMGFILGPFVQTGLVEIHYPGPVEEDWLHFNMYTAPALLSGLCTIINFILVLFFFRPREINNCSTTRTTLNSGPGAEENSGYIKDDEEGAAEEDQETGEREIKKKKSMSSQFAKVLVKLLTGFVAAVTITIYLFFITFFIFTTFETIGTPLTMDMYGWSKSDASTNMGLVLGGSGLVALAVFFTVITLSKRGVDERKLLLAGFIFCFIGFCGLLPWGHDLPAIAPAPIDVPTTPLGKLANTALIANSTVAATDTSTQWPTASPMTMAALMTSTTLASVNTTVTPRGCPWYFAWCESVPKIQLWQFLLGTFFIAVGYATCNCMVYSIYSKMLPPGPQGMWMGIITAFGSLARMLGPIFVSQIYDSYGPRVTFASIAGILLFTIFTFVIGYRWLVPYDKLMELNKRTHGQQRQQQQDEDNACPAPAPTDGSLQ